MNDVSNQQNTSSHIDSYSYNKAINDFYAKCIEKIDKTEEDLTMTELTLIRKQLLEQIQDTATIVTICFNTQDIDKFLELNDELGKLGCFVLGNVIDPETQEIMKYDHRKKIESADFIYFIVKDNEMDEIMKSEYNYAKSFDQDKTIRLYSV